MRYSGSAISSATADIPKHDKGVVLCDTEPLMESWAFLSWPRLVDVRSRSLGSGLVFVVAPIGCTTSYSISLNGEEGACRDHASISTTAPHIQCCMRMMINAMQNKTCMLVFLICACWHEHDHILLSLQTPLNPRAFIDLRSRIPCQ
jgi:hypothetical protein